MGGNDRGPAASGEKRLLVQGAAATSGGEAEECPRCGSHNTKFCYFNNYNLSQPRHFCKACRRYWTLGGTLRNVPVGGSTRRASQHQSKHQLSAAASCTRRRSVPAPPPVVAASPSSSSSSSPPLSSRLVFDTPSVIPPSAAHKAELPGAAEDSGSMDAVRSFESLLAEPLPAGFLALGEPFLDGREGFGLGLGLGGSPGEIMEEMSFGLGKSSAWPFFGEEEGSLVGGNGNTAVSCVGGVDADREAWQDGSDGVDYFGWPELSMRSTVGKSMR